jgi:hypothetical protein
VDGSWSSWPARLVVLNVSQHSSGIESDRIKLVSIPTIICPPGKFECVGFGDFLQQGNEVLPIFAAVDLSNYVSSDNRPMVVER